MYVMAKVSWVPLGAGVDIGGDIHSPNGCMILKGVDFVSEVSSIESESEERRHEKRF